MTVRRILLEQSKASGSIIHFCGKIGRSLSENIAVSRENRQNLAVEVISFIVLSVCIVPTSDSLHSNDDIQTPFAFLLCQPFDG